MEEFKQARARISEANQLHYLHDALHTEGFVGHDFDEGRLTTRKKPFNIFAKVAIGEIVQEEMIAENEKLAAEHQKRYMIACNRKECDDHWEDGSEQWIGKASEPDRLPSDAS